MAKPKFKPRKQVAALVIRRDPTEGLRVMLVTSRGTKRYVAPKGWRMKGRQDHDAAQIEAMQEAGVVGKIRKKPIGFYEYWKRLSDHFELCRVKVFLLEVERQLADWKERGQRQDCLVRSRRGGRSRRRAWHERHHPQPTCRKG